MFSQRFACPVSGFTIDEIEPRLFSFNAPAGACPTCDGLGSELRFEPDLVVRIRRSRLKKARSIRGPRPACRLLITSRRSKASPSITSVDEDTVGELPKCAARDPLRLGRRGHRLHLLGRHALHSTEKPFEGVIGNIDGASKETDSDWVREELSRYQAAHRAKRAAAIA
jgi:excinuclease ABC subunit A